MALQAICQQSEVSLKPMALGRLPPELIEKIVETAVLQIVDDRLFTGESRKVWCRHYVYFVKDSGRGSCLLKGKIAHMMLMNGTLMEQITDALIFGYTITDEIGYLALINRAFMGACLRALARMATCLERMSYYARENGQLWGLGHCPRSIFLDLEEILYTIARS